jgi:hypothetical protein
MTTDEWLDTVEMYFGNVLADVSKNVIGLDIWRRHSDAPMLFIGEFKFADFSGETIRTNLYTTTAKFVKIWDPKEYHGGMEFHCELQDPYGRKVLSNIGIDGPESYDKLVTELTAQMKELYGHWYDWTSLKRTYLSSITR